jgi:ABC-type multidrug transport system fused ATPase/permease subunit
MKDIRSLTWPAASLDEAVGTLARAAGLVASAADHETAPLAPGEGGWGDNTAIDRAARRHGVESRAVDAAVSDLGVLCRAAAPLLLRLTIDGDERFVCMLEARRTRLHVVAPDGTRQRIAMRQVARRLAPPEATNVRVVDFLAQAIAGRRTPTRRQRARIAAFTGANRLCGCWALRVPSGGLRTLARDTPLKAHLGRFVILHPVQYGLWLAAWMILLQLALHAQFGTPDLRAWTLTLGTIALARAWQAQAARGAALCGGTMIKRRLLDAVLRLQVDRIRHAGVGHFLGRVLEGEAIESAGLAGAFQATNALVGATVGLFVLAHGAGGWPHAALLAAWIGAILTGSGMYYRRRRTWTELRFALTTLNVEQMVGHRTRLAQQDGSAWHSAEDRLLQQYVTASVRVDRAAVALDVLRRGWFYAGLLGIAAPFITGTAAPSAIAVSVAGVVIAAQAFSSWTDSLARLAGALIAARSLRAFWQTMESSDQPGSRTLQLGPSGTDARASAPALEAIDLSFTHDGRGTPSIAHASLSVQAGERVLVQGASGCGKSTLASLLAGLRAPASGLLLLNGLDAGTVGTRAWRRRVVLVPQFHDNHIFVGTLAFNLLMGRRWPPTRDDMEQAATACEQLGLGSLLERMPLGLQQPVGESGWQLSHGERSRVYAARALLQDPDVTILDESFAALDPGTVDQCVNVMIDRARTFVMIAHP